MKISKRYKAALAVADLQKVFPLEEAIEVLNKMPKAKFDETVELSIRVGVDPRQSSQMVRGVINLPNGSGKSARVIVFTDKAEEAKAAGADEAGLAELIKKIQDGWLDFDVAIATPAAMKEVRNIARVLGPRGLMPNPKSGTVTDDVAGALKDIKQGGRVEFKMDKTANIGVVVGKRSFEPGKLAENILAAVEVIGKARPDGLRGKYILNMTIASTMSAGVKLDNAIYANY